MPFTPEIRGKINKVMRLNIKLLAKVDETDMDLTDVEEELLSDIQNMKESYVKVFGGLPPEPDPVPKKKPVIRKKPSKKERLKAEAEARGVSFTEVRRENKQRERANVKACQAKWKKEHQEDK